MNAFMGTWLAKTRQLQRLHLALTEWRSGGTATLCRLCLCRGAALGTPGTKSATSGCYFYISTCINLFAYA
jgi:hypothetical protein